MLSKEPTKEEVLNNLNAMNANSIAGLDGFTT